MPGIPSEPTVSHTPIHLILTFAMRSGKAVERVRPQFAVGFRLVSVPEQHEAVEVALADQARITDQSANAARRVCAARKAEQEYLVAILIIVADEGVGVAHVLRQADPETAAFDLVEDVALASDPVLVEHDLRNAACRRDRRTAWSPRPGATRWSGRRSNRRRSTYRRSTPQCRFIAIVAPPVLPPDLATLSEVAGRKVTLIHLHTRRQSVALTACACQFPPRSSWSS